MKSISRILSLTITIVALQLSAAAPPSVAVLNFSTGRGMETETGAQIATVLSALMSAEGDLVMVDRAGLTELLSEQELGLSGTVNSATAAKVGQITGARVLVTGNVFRAGNETLAVAKVIGTETSRTYGLIAKGGRAVRASGGEDP